ncbi:hypothetical protein ASPACDRAFT_114456 [Aspergillus aculeatus ATCC 16872]|uniref:Uncharacterized protein n=1 Tax=Aspergillus aculeatus (strain ATCC 16872 / CBS 172.66 / WB 5094) TaxID=690307 RepID=A0A1L9X0S6_ASPA1|nr:uncharacterized protein ASPACDRAFT_114456 [Aspergillus aculeatus ATCC 16872]OJK01956.1 hypothetical protein ASPACDRAFT_114456 [Aspergillus aculeatus ATCC 16872]
MMMLSLLPVNKAGELPRVRYFAETTIFSEQTAATRRWCCSFLLLVVDHIESSRRLLGLRTWGRLPQFLVSNADPPALRLGATYLIGRDPGSFLTTWLAPYHLTPVKDGCMMYGWECDRVERGDHNRGFWIPARSHAESADAQQFGGFASQRESYIDGTRLFTSVCDLQGRESETV